LSLDALIRHVPGLIERTIRAGHGRNQRHGHPRSAVRRTPW
jgi:hypothetical protein